MGYIEDLVGEFERTANLPWERNLAGQQKVWFVIYLPAEERRLRARIEAFELASKRAGHEWRHVDITDVFADWMAAQEYRESYFDSPEDIDLLLPEFTGALASKIRPALQDDLTTANTIVAVSGLASLFGLARVSEVVQAVSADIRGRLLVFFPGERDGSNYRLLDAREGWNYLALPISVNRGE